MFNSTIDNNATPQMRGFGNYLRQLNPDATLIIANRNDVSFEKPPLRVLLTEKAALENQDLPTVMATYRTNKRDKATQEIKNIAKAESWTYIDVSKLACDTLEKK